MSVVDIINTTIGKGCAVSLILSNSALTLNVLLTGMPPLILDTYCAGRGLISLLEGYFYSFGDIQTFFQGYPLHESSSCHILLKFTP